MRDKLLSILSNLAFFIIALVILYLSFRGVDFKQVIAEIYKTNFYWIILSLLLAFAGDYFRAVRWKMQITPLGFYPSQLHALYAVFIGNISNLAIPRVGDLMRTWSLRRTDNIPIAPMIGTVVTERITDVIIVFALMFPVFFYHAELISPLLFEEVLTPLLSRITAFSYSVFIILIIVLLLILVLSKRWFSKFYIKGVPIGMLKSFFDGFRSLLKMNQPINFIILTIFMWAGYLISFYVCFYAFESTSQISLQHGVLILALAVLSMLIPVQGGVGAYHWLIANGLMLIGISREESLAFALITHAASILFILLSGMAAFVPVLLTKK